MQLLIADDDRMMRVLLTRMISAWGYEVVEAEDGNAAWERLCAPEPPRIAVLDWMMPGLDGVAICQRLVERSERLEVYTILLTLRNSKEDVVRALDSGAHDFLSKPVDANELRSRIAVGRRLIETDAKLLEYAAEKERLAEALSERLELERRLVAERLALEAQVRKTKKIESLGLMAGGIAHDFNNLLQGILGGTDILLKSMAPEATGRKMLENIRKAATRAAELSGQMLAYSGRGMTISAHVALPDLLEHVTKQMGGSMLKGIAIQRDFPETLAPMQGDARQLGQAFENVLTNAAEAIGAGGGGRITIGARSRQMNREELAQTYVDDHLPPGRYMAIDVSDTGCGMSADQCEKVFDPFFTTKFLGRGLGMAAVLGIVRGHRGAIAVKSALGEGTTVSLYFPLEISPIETPKKV